MKNIFLPTLFVLATLVYANSSNTVAAEILKVSQVEKEQLFKTTQYWQQEHEARFKPAPAAIQQKILLERADLVKRGKLPRWRASLIVRTTRTKKTIANRSPVLWR